MNKKELKARLQEVTIPVEDGQYFEIMDKVDNSMYLILRNRDKSVELVNELKSPDYRTLHSYSGYDEFPEDVKERFLEVIERWHRGTPLGSPEFVEAWKEVFG